MLTFVLFASSFENTALKGPRSVQADLFDFVVPAWSDGTQADMDVSERILASWMPAIHTGMTTMSESVVS